MGSYSDHSGKKFGMLTAVEFVRAERRGNQNVAIWKFVCDCGKVTVRPAAEVTRKRRYSGITSCGCMRGENIAAPKRLEAGVASFNNLYTSYASSKNAKRRGFSLTKDQFKALTQSDCYYCGQKPIQSYRDRAGGVLRNNGDYIYNGVDRVINDLGYTYENSVACCWRCNQMKRDMDAEDFIRHLSKIVNRLGT